MQLQTIDPKPLRTFFTDRDIMRDLFTILDYISNRKLRRMVRTNEIPHADLNRIAKLLGNLAIEPGDDGISANRWIYFLDNLAQRLQLVSIDMYGEYRINGQPTGVLQATDLRDAFPPAGKALSFLELSPVEQEKSLLELLINAETKNEYSSYSYNEFYQISVVGELDAFGRQGSSTGVMTVLKFPEIRKFLLKILKACPIGEWISTESLIAYLKANHRYFLIPEKLPQPKNKWETIGPRYANFYESDGHWGKDTVVPDDAPDGFERVEGRYVERFLEYIPLIMRFVDLAYDPNPYSGLLPQRGILKAFRVTERFNRLFSTEESTPKITIQPNFDVVVESDFYPASLIHQLSRLGELVSSPNSGHNAYVGIFQLKKTGVAAEQVKNPNLDVISLLKNLSGRDLPPNVQIELDEWSAHADQFTLFEGFGLLEMSDIPLETEIFSAETISSSLRLVHSCDKVFTTLEMLGNIPLRIKHPTWKIASIPSNTSEDAVSEKPISVFPKEITRAKLAEQAKHVRVPKVVTFSYQFPDTESFDSVKKMLAELRCPFQSDPGSRTINLQQKEQSKFDEAVQNLKSKFIIEIE